MIHTVKYVAESQRLHPESLLRFAETHRGAFRERPGGELLTSTMLVDELLTDFKAQRRMLSTVPLHELKIGDQLISAKGNPGRIKSFDLGNSVDPDTILVDIVWDTPEGNTYSSQPLLLLNSVEYIGRSE